MYKKIKLFVAAAALTALACNDASTDHKRADGYGDKPQTKEDSLRHEVMEGHDIGMAKMGKLRKYLAMIQQQQDSIQKLPAARQDQAYLQMLATLKDELSNADKAMNDWMERYKDDSAKGNEPLRIQYLESEKDKVTIVKDMILHSMQRADSLLGKK